MALDFQPIESTPPEKGGIDFQPTESKIDFQPAQAEASDVPNPLQKPGTETHPWYKEGVGNIVKGAMEGAQHFMSGAGGYLPSVGGAALRAITNGTSFEDEMRADQRERDLAVEPTTKTGEKVQDTINEAMNRAGIPAAGLLHMVPAPMRSRGKAAPEIPPPKATVAPKVGPVVPDPVAEGIAREGQAGNPYIPSGAKMTVDENGMPIRQDLSEQAAPVNPAQGELFRPNPEFDQAGQADRAAQAQAAITARQAALEEQMRRNQAMAASAQHSLTEQAPTGFEAWQEALRQDAQRRIPGNNEPMDMPRRTYPVSTEDFPQVLKDVPETQPGLDLTQDTASRMARPFEQDMENPPVRPDVASWEGEGGNQAVSTAGKANPAEAYWNGGKMTGRSPGNRQRGAVNMDLFTPGFEKLKMINNGIQLRLKGGFDPVIQAVDRFGKQVGELKLNTDTFEQKPSSNLQAGYVHVDPAMRGRGIAEQMYRFASEHGDVQADMGHLLEAGRKMWEGFEKRGLATDEWTIPMKGNVPASQRGGLNFQAHADLVNKAVDKLHEVLDKINPLTPKEQVLANAVGKPMIPKPEDVSTGIPKALAEGKDGTAFDFTSRVQSGLANVAEKTGSYAQQLAARWLHYGEKVGDYYNSKVVNPVAKAFARLSSSELSSAMQVLRQEMHNRARYSEEELGQHLTPKAAQAYKQLRAAFDDVLNRTNAALRDMGKPEVQPHEAYLASMWDGDWHVPVSKGNSLVWQVRARSRSEAVKAIDWIKKNTELDVKPSDIKYRPGMVGRKIPPDVLGAYNSMMEFFKDDPEIARNIQEAGENYLSAKGFKFLGHDVHFSNKAGMDGVRGSLGDRPWLDEHTNNVQGAKAQVKYLQDAYRWVPMQEALAQVKKLVLDKDLSAQQPNNLKMVRMYTAQAMGMSKNLFGSVEKALQQLTTRFSPAGALSPFVSSIKTLTYLTQLGLSAGYMISTPLQSFVLGPAWHMKLSGEGAKYNILTTAVKAMADMGGLVGKPMSSLGKAAFKYMEDNGIIRQNVFHENAGLGEYAPIRLAKNTVGKTIEYPERVARASTFLSFAHHLDESGLYKGRQEEMFQRAEELTNHVLTDFRRSSRPALVDNLGQMGELMYTYKSATFNYFNNLSVMAKDAQKGRPGPLLAALGMTGLMAGYTGMPLVNEMDEMWNIAKEWVAKNHPDWYPSIRDVSIKGSVIQNIRQVANSQQAHDILGDKTADLLRDTATHGIVSALTGTQQSSRFSANVGDIHNPLSNIAPAIQEARELVSAAKAFPVVGNPSSANINEAVWQQMPPALKGTMENTFDSFKTVNQGGKQGMANPNHLAEHETVYNRTPKEQALRYGGLTSLEESNTKNDWYQTKQEAERWKAAQESSVDKIWDSALDKDKEAMAKYVKAYYLNYGNDDGLEAALDKKIDAYIFNPRQRAIMKAETLNSIMEIKHYMQLHGSF